MKTLSETAAAIAAALGEDADALHPILSGHRDRGMFGEGVADKPRRGRAVVYDENAQTKMLVLVWARRVGLEGSILREMMRALDRPFSSGHAGVLPDPPFDPKEDPWGQPQSKYLARIIAGVKAGEEWRLMIREHRTIAPDPFDGSLVATPGDFEATCVRVSPRPFDLMRLGSGKDDVVIGGLVINLTALLRLYFNPPRYEGDAQ